MVLSLLNTSLLGLHFFLGDGWEHDVHTEQKVSTKRYEPPLLGLAGVNACPPEDVGGPFSYPDFLGIIRDPKDKEHRSTLPPRRSRHQLGARSFAMSRLN